MIEIVSIRFFDRKTLFNDLAPLFPPHFKFVNLNQTHSSDVLVIDQFTSEEKPKADAAVTKLSEVVLTVHTADCLPLVGHGDGVIGVCHAGWRGLSLGVIENWIAKMGMLGAKKENIKISIGPSIGPCHFEVGKDVGAQIVSSKEIPVKFLGAVKRPHSDPKKEFIDLRAIARFKLVRLGISATSIQISDECTYCHTDRFFSYRRDGQGNRLEGTIVKSRG